MGHRKPGARDPAVLRNIFNGLKAMMDGGGSSSGGPPTPSSESNDLSDSQSSIPTQTLIISSEREQEKLAEADAVTDQYRELDADFLRGDWLARLFYGCLSDDPDYEMREVAWRYNQLEFLCRFVLQLDAYCYDHRHRDERICCGVLDPRTQLELQQVLLPENWNSAHMCPYRQWSDFVGDYNAWGRGEGPKPRWMPKAPVMAKKAAEDVLAVYIVAAIDPIRDWFLGTTTATSNETCPSPMLTCSSLTDQFLRRCNPLHSLEPVLRSISRCTNGTHNKDSGFYEAALQMWSYYGSFVPRSVERTLRASDLQDSMGWMNQQQPSIGGMLS